MSFQNLQGDVTVYALSVKLGMPAISSNKQYIDIPYVGVSSPDSSTIAMIKYQYSLDGGATYADMTPVSNASISNLNFTEAGTDLTFEWDAKKDIGNDLYNRTLTIVLQAEGFDLTSSEVSRSFIFNKTTINAETERAKKPFPDTYQGIDGNKYKQSKMPRTR